MSEYIKREDVEKMIQEQFALDDKDLRHIKQMVIDQLPSIDIVKCRDCKWWTKQSASIQGRCALSGTYPTGAWFCANGERKEQEDE